MALTHIASVTASSSATLSFTSGIDATYNEYQFHYVGIHPATANTQFQYQVNASDDTVGGFDTSLITSSAFRAYHDEGGTTTQLLYRTGADQAQVAGFQWLSPYIGNGDDNVGAGVLTLYAPSSTTFVKHFTSTGSSVAFGAASATYYIAGYINQPLAIPEISFKMSSGNIDSGTIHMYGVG